MKTLKIFIGNFLLIAILFIGCKEEVPIDNPDEPTTPEKVISGYAFASPNDIPFEGNTTLFYGSNEYVTAVTINGDSISPLTGSIILSKLPQDTTFIVVFSRDEQKVIKTVQISVGEKPEPPIVYVPTRTDTLSNRDWNFTKQIVWVNEWQKWDEVALSESQKTKKITFDRNGDLKINGQYSGPWFWIGEKDSVNITGNERRYSDLTDTTFTTYSSNGTTVNFYTRK